METRRIQSARNLRPPRGPRHAFHATTTPVRRRLVAWTTLVAVIATMPASVWAQGQPPALTDAERAAAFSQIAKEEAKKQNYVHCAELYRKAFDIDAATLGYLYSAARCEQKAEQFEAAMRHYDTFLTRAPADDALRAKAESFREECAAALEAQRRKEQEQKRADEEKRKEEEQRETRRAEEARKRREAAAAAPQVKGKPVTSVVSHPVPAWRKPVGWIGVAVGVAALGAGAYFVQDGRSTLDKLDSDLKQAKESSTDGIIRTFSRDAAESREREGNRSVSLGGAMLGAGLVSGGLGVWMLFSGSSKRIAVQPRPDLKGLRVSLKF